MFDIFGIKKRRDDEIRDKAIAAAKRELAKTAELERIAEERERIENIARDAKRKQKADERKAKKEAEKAKLKNTPKEKATENGEPWVEVLSMDIDENDPGNGAFELDWNDVFVARLVKAGYQGKTDQDIVDNWFKTVCRNILTEAYEQDQADPTNRSAHSNQRDLGNGRTEHS